MVLVRIVPPPVGATWAGGATGRPMARVPNTPRSWPAGPRRWPTSPRDRPHRHPRTCSTFFRGASFPGTWSMRSSPGPGATSGAGRLHRLLIPPGPPRRAGHADGPKDGEIRNLYSTEDEPDGVLLTRVATAGLRPAPRAPRPTGRTPSISSPRGFGVARALPRRTRRPRGRLRRSNTCGSRRLPRKRRGYNGGDQRRFRAVEGRRPREQAGRDLGFCLVVLTDINANHVEIASELVEIEWSDLRGDPDRADQRSEIQRRRHAENPHFHDSALGALERGRKVRAWSEEQILQAIREFHARVGRPPAYEEFRKKCGLPDYKTVWRRFGSSKVAVEIAFRDGADHAQ